MKKVFELKPRVNKRNGQINISIPRKSLPKNLVSNLKKDPSMIKSLRFKMEGVDFN